MLIRLIGVRFSHLVSGGYQINLFDDNEEQISLYTAMDELRKKFGDRAVMKAAGIDTTKPATKSKWKPKNKK